MLWDFIRPAGERRTVQRHFRDLRVAASSPGVPAVALSGGNQQKLVLAKWFARDCHTLILDEPNRGVDVGGKAEIHAIIDRQASSGRGVLLISSELSEILNLSTRILVLREGCVVGEVSREQATQHKIMQLMAGVETCCSG